MPQKIRNKSRIYMLIINGCSATFYRRKVPEMDAVPNALQPNGVTDSYNWAFFWPFPGLMNNYV